MFAELAKWWKRTGNPASGSPQDYRVYTTEFDRVIHGNQLPALLGPEREAEFQVKASELDPALSRWRAAAELAAVEDVRAYASKHRVEDSNDTVACLLLDHSGSLRGQRAILATAIAEIVAGYWSRIGIRYEILGFTTLSWKGGRSREKWIKSGRPANPGRLCDLLHIVYRSADGRYTQPPRSVRNLIREELTKENVDGEAVAWALGRLRNRHEARKILIVVSDGAPVDESTLGANTGNCLDRHLKDVIASIDEAGDIWLAGIGLGYDVSRYYAHCVSIASTDELSRVVRFIANCTDVPIAPGPRRQSVSLKSRSPPLNRRLRRLICFLLYIAMICAGGTPLVTMYFNYRAGSISLTFLATCGFLVLFGMYLLFTDFVLPAKRQ
jgi:cobaltochelatase CobT